MKNVRLAVVLLTHCFFAGVCLGQDGAVIGAFGGLGDTPQKTAPGWAGGTWAAGTHSFAYSIGYRQDLRRRLSASFTYVNQGHYDRHGYGTDHHSRDDAQVELLFAQRPGGGPVEFRFGGGPAYYSETDKSENLAGAFQNRQGFGLVVSGMVDVDLSDRLFVELRAHRHVVFDRYGATNALLGVGFRWHREEHQTRDTRNLSKHFIRLNYGLGTLNSTRSESLRRSFQVAHEMDVSKHFRTSVSYLREGDAYVLNRMGFALQGIVKQQLARAVTLGFGLGPYINADRSDFFRRRDKVSVDALFTAFLDFKVSEHVELSVSTGRPRSITSLQNKPMTDVYQAGLRFRLPF